MAEYMQERRLPVEERIRLAVKNLTPTASPADLAKGQPVVEIRKYLSMLENEEEMGGLAAAMHMRKSLRKPIVLMKAAHSQKWEIIMISDGYLPKGDELRYRRTEAGGKVMWIPIDEYGEKLVPTP